MLNFNFKIHKITCLDSESYSSRIIAIIAITIIVLVGFSSCYTPTSAYAETRPLDVIWFGRSDEAGSGSPDAVLHLQNQGFQVEHRNRPIENLTDAKVIVVAPTGIFNTFSNSEISNLTSFVNGGGRLIFAADTDYFHCSPDPTQCALEITRDFGFAYSGDLQYGDLVPATGQTGHPIWNMPNRISSFTDWCCDAYVPTILDPTNVKIIGVASAMDASSGSAISNGSAIVLNENPAFNGGKVLGTGWNMLAGESGDFRLLDNVISFMISKKPTIHSGSSRDSYNPPSIGNDYHNQYGGGITINGKPFDITNYHSIIPQQILNTGTPATFDFKIYGERGANTIQHVGMYFHFKGDVSVPNADTWISWDKHDGIQIHDPNKIFASHDITTKTDGNYLYATFTLTPQNTMPDSSLVMRMWDDKRATGDVPIWGAIIIVDPNAPIPVQKVPDNQYDDYITLKNILDQDGYEIPSLLRIQRDMQVSYDSVDINWVYDKGSDKMTMVESDKSGNVIGDVVYKLFKKSEQPKITDHDYVYIPKQLDRQDMRGEQDAMQQEIQKAEKFLIQKEYLESTPNFTPSAAAILILGDFSHAKVLQLYYDNPQDEYAAKKDEAEKAEKLLESLGMLRQNNFESLPR